MLPRQQPHFDFEPLIFKPCPNHSANANSVLVALVTAAVVAYFLMSKPMKPYVSSAEGGVRAAIGFVSAKLSMDEGACEKVDGDANTSESAKAAAEARARAWMATHPDAVIVVGVNWCQHCQNMKASVEALSKKLGRGKVLMINADALPRSAWKGDGAIHNLEYFPTILASRGGQAEVCSSLDQAEAIASGANASAENASAENASAENASGDDEPPSAAAAVSFFNDLF